jgi:hypothetical protein
MSNDTQVHREVHGEVHRDLRDGPARNWARTATAGEQPSHKFTLALQLARRRRLIGLGPAQYKDHEPEECETAPLSWAQGASGVCAPRAPQAP